MHASRWLSSTTLVALLALCAGCPSTKQSAEGTRQAPAATCTKEGQSCEFAPGKIGICSARLDGCDGSTCLACTSLH